MDCDNDTVLFLVEQVGGIACHTGHESCFYRRINRDGSFEIVDKKLQDEVEV